MGELLGEVERAIAGEFPLEPIPEIAGQLSFDLAVEEAAAAGVAVTATDFFPVLVILGMVAAATAWMRPLLKGQHAAHHSLLFRVVTWPASRLLHGLKVIEARVLHAMSHWLAPKLQPVTHWLRSTTHLLHLLAQDVGDLADSTHEAFVWLRHHVVPKMIVAALKPVIAAVNATVADLNALKSRLQRAVDAAADTLAAAGVTVTRTMLGVLTGLAALVVALRAEVYEVLAPAVRALGARVSALETYIFSELEQRVTTLEEYAARLKNQIIPDIQKALLPEALLAAVAAAAGILWRNLTCENTQTVAHELCATDPNLVKQSLSGLLDVLVLADICELGHLGMLAAEAFEPVLSGLVGATNYICLAGGASGPTAITQADAPGLF